MTDQCQNNSEHDLRNAFTIQETDSKMERLEVPETGVETSFFIDRIRLNPIRHADLQGQGWIVMRLPADPLDAVHLALQSGVGV